MYSYLYIFEDGEAKVSNKMPSLEDSRSIGAGVLLVIRSEGKFRVMLVDGTWKIME